jgi:Uma2 family endonuclease
MIRKILAETSEIVKLRGVDFDAMVQTGAFDVLPPMKIELIYGELLFMSPAGPFHEDYIDYLNRWSCDHTEKSFCNVRVQSGVACDDHRPEPDLAWLKPGRYARNRATNRDALLVIEVSDSSLEYDLQVKARLYAEEGIPEYWVVDVANQLMHVHRQGDGARYRSLQVFAAPAEIAPLCRPTALLHLGDLFVPNE